MSGAGHPSNAFTVEDATLIGRCLEAAVRGPFFPDWEFETLFGLTRERLGQISAGWPGNASEPETQSAVCNTFTNLLGYPHRQKRRLCEMVAADSAQLEQLGARIEEACRRRRCDEAGADMPAVRLAVDLMAVSGTPLDALVTGYRAAAAFHSQATAAGDHVAANRHHDIAAAIYRELRTRGPSAQEALLPLLQDDDPSVRTWAATHALEFVPQQAEPVLAALAAGRGLQALNAMMTLRVWRRGDLSFP